MKTYYKGYVIDSEGWIWKDLRLIEIVKNLHEAKDFIDKLNR